LVATSTMQGRKRSPCLLLGVPIVVIAVIVIQINVAMPQLPWFHRCPLFRCNDDTAKLCVNSRSIVTIQKIIVCHFATVAAVSLAMLQQLSMTQPLCCHHFPCTVCLCCCCLELIVFSAYLFSLLWSTVATCWAGKKCAVAIQPPFLLPACCCLAGWLWLFLNFIIAVNLATYC